MLEGYALNVSNALGYILNMFAFFVRFMCYVNMDVKSIFNPSAMESCIPIVLSYEVPCGPSNLFVNDC